MRRRQATRARPRVLGILFLFLGGWVFSQNSSLTPEEMLKEAVELHRQGEWPAAIHLYEAFLSLHPGVADVRYNLGAAYAAAGHFAEAIYQYEQAIQIGSLSDPASLQFNLAWAYFKSGRFREAYGPLNNLLSEHPGDRRALLLLAYCQLLENNNEKVIELLSPLESELGADPQFVYLLGSAFIQNGQIETGERWARELLTVRETAEARLMLGKARLAAGDYFRALEELNRALELDPGLPSANSALGNVLRIMTRFEEADAAFRRELEVNPADFDANFFHGVFLFNSQNFREALLCFERAHEARPGDLQVAFQIGLVYDAMNRTQDAVQIIGKVMEASPDYMEGHATLARLYARLGQRHDAERHSSLAEGLRMLSDGRQLIQAGRLEEALPLFKRLKELNPADPRPYFFLGLILSRQEDWPAAGAELKEALRLDPDNLNVKITYAGVLSRTGQVEQAVGVLGSFDERWLNELQPELVWTVCDTYHRAGNYSEALRVLDALNRLSPSDPRVSLARGQIYLARRQYGQAVHSLQSLLKSDPNQPQAQALLAEIFLSQGLLAQAYVHLRNLEGSNPDSKMLPPLLAQYWFQRRDYNRARDHALKARDAQPSNPEVRNLLGNIYLAQGETKRAVEEYTAAARLDPERPEFQINLEVARKRLPE